jgi:hypothetical protein
MPKRHWMPLLLGMMLSVGCAPTLVPIQGAVEAPGVARVELREIKKDLIDLQVINISQQPLTVDRNSFYLAGPTGTQERLPGGRRTTYVVQPGKVRVVRMKFDRRSLPRGVEVQLAMPEAILIEGQPVPMPPILLGTQ